MSKLLLELFSEEIPSFDQIEAVAFYQEMSAKLLADANISFENIAIYSGPRRIIFSITGLHYKQLDNYVIRGCKVDSPMGALEGFCRKYNIKQTDLMIRDGYYFYQQPATNLDIEKSLMQLLPKVIASYNWSKSMYWGEYETTWIRPLHNILCLLDDKILPITFGHLTASNITYGHRLTSDTSGDYKGKQLTINTSNYQEYASYLKDHKVIVDQDERKELILESIKTCCNDKKLEILQDLSLLNEINGLVEYPVAFLAEIPHYQELKALGVPSELISTAMRNHQKYFTVCQDGQFVPYFIFISNNYLSLSDKEIYNNIILGNIKVLAARLKDAQYLYESDLRKYNDNPSSITHSLKQREFYKGLGSLYDKQLRLQYIVSNIFDNPQHGTIKGILQLATEYCKYDLVFEIVNEFPELQGIIGSNIINNKNDNVKLAIKEHYLPKDAKDNISSNIYANLLAIIDKMDNLVGFMISGIRVTSSSDPYGLRRLAISIIRIVDSLLSVKRYDVTDQANPLLSGTICTWLTQSDVITSLLKVICDAYIEIVKIEITSAQMQLLSTELIEFIIERLHYYYKSKYPNLYLFVPAIFKDYGNHILLSMIKIEEINNLLNSQKINNLLITYKRVNNIIKANSLDTYNSKPSLYTKEDTSVLELLNKDCLNNNDNLSVINEYLNNVLINDPSPAIASNRYFLLNQLKNKLLDILKISEVSMDVLSQLS